MMQLFCNTFDTAGTGKRCHRIQLLEKLKVKAGLAVVL